MITTTVCRIDLAATPDLQAALDNLCNAQGNVGARLATSFVHGNQLVLVFLAERR